MNSDLNHLINEINKAHKTLWILCGLPYSGKTYLSKKLLEKTELVYVSVDHFFKEAGYDWDSNHLPEAVGWQKIFNQTYDISEQALKDNKNVLYDSTNHTKISRDILREMAKKVGGKTRVIFVDVANNIIWKRWEESVKERNRSVIPKNLVQMTIDSFEIPQKDEKVFSYRP